MSYCQFLGAVIDLEGMSEEILAKAFISIAESGTPKSTDEELAMKSIAGKSIRESMDSMDSTLKKKRSSTTLLHGGQDPKRMQITLQQLFDTIKNSA